MKKLRSQTNLQLGNKKRLKHALSFDIEDWFHIPGIPHVERRGNWQKYSRDSLVEEKTLLILDILERYNTKATFFVLGWIADMYPDLVKEIARRDHEIASHGYWHYRVYTLSRSIFKNYLEQSIEVLESVTGKRVKGFRAPSFSIIPGTEWAFEVMQEVGLEYDASLFPAQRGYGGYVVDQKPQLLPSEISETNFIELPMSVLKIGTYSVPFSGGGYLRFWPGSILKYGFNKMEENGHPAVVYLHPRDFAKDCPRVKMSPLKRFKCYYNLDSTEGKLQMLLENYEFGTCEEVLKNWFQVSSLKDLYQEADFV